MVEPDFPSGPGSVTFQLFASVFSSLKEIYKYNDAYFMSLVSDELRKDFIWKYYQVKGILVVTM